MVVLEIIFWICASAVAYTYLGFPLLIALRARLFPRPLSGTPTSYSVSVIVVAHNEEDSIGQKIENILRLRKKTCEIEVIIASDGSTDKTCSIVDGFSSTGVMLLDLPRRGKAHALNIAAEKARGDILVFSDANSMFADDAIERLIEPFDDSSVGGVAGDQRYNAMETNSGNDGERAYWSLDRLLKRWESRAGNVISATGAIYAIRRHLFLAVPDGVTDDFVTSTRVILQGYRLVFAEEAAAYEPVAQNRQIEFGRKVRVMTRGLRGVVAVKELLNPCKYGFYSLQLLSHKVLRRLIVIPLIVLFCISGVLVPYAWIYGVAFLCQSVFYAVALAGLLVRVPGRGLLKAANFPAYFCLVNVAALIALVNTVRGRRIDLWEPQRTPDVPVV